MRIGEVDLPSEILEAQDSDKLVVFAGAGVSVPKPSSYPSFVQLVEKIAGRRLRKGEMGHLDRVLSELEEGGRNVRRAAKDMLTNPASKPNSLHRDTLRLFQRPESVRIVTTNFDRHFTSAARAQFGSKTAVFDDGCAVFRAPALPLGRDFHGIVYLHGSVEQDDRRLVLTDRDYGRAYVTEGWAAQFLRELYNEFTVLFIGYGHKDPITDYLARGLPPSGKNQRYALTVPREAAHWEKLDIRPVPYPAKGNHIALVKMLGRWADRTEWGSLEHEHRIREIVGGSTVLDPETEDYLVGALKHPQRVQFFTRHATAPDWLKWADEKGAWKPLFTYGHECDDVAKELAHWFATKFVKQHANDALALIARQDAQVNFRLWIAIAEAVANERGGFQDGERSNWINLLVAAAYPGIESWYLEWILYNCDPAKDIGAAVLLFSYLTRPRLKLRESWMSHVPGYESHSVYWEERHHNVGTNWLARAWSDLLKPNMACCAEEIAAVVTGHLSLAHIMFQSVGQADIARDGFAFAGEPIEEADIDYPRRPLELTAVAAKDTIAWLLEHQEDRGVALLNAWFASEAPILRRLAVHGVSCRTDMDADSKINWLLENRLLYEHYAKPEVFHVLSEAYLSAGTTSRLRLLDAVERGPDRETALGES